MAHELTVHFRRIGGTEASIGWAGVKSIVADRPKGRAGGLGIGLSGGELLALSLGAGFHNQLFFSAEKLNLTITSLEIDVTVEVGEDMMVSGSKISIQLDVESGPEDRTRLLEDAKCHSSVSNSVEKGFPVIFENALEE